MHAKKSDQNSTSKCLNPIPGRIPRKMHGRIHKLPDSLKWAFFKIPLLACYETLLAHWKYVSKHAQEISDQNSTSRCNFPLLRYFTVLLSKELIINSCLGKIS